MDMSDIFGGGLAALAISLTPSLAVAMVVTQRSAYSWQ